MTNPADLGDLRLMRRREVEFVCGISRSQLYAMMAKGRFPSPVLINEDVGRGVGWRVRDVRVWLESRQCAHETKCP